MNSHVQQIKERLSIEDVVSSYIKLEKAGGNLKAKCPFHNEKTPSFFISPARGSFYCFGCGMKGDIFSFVEEFEGLDFRGSLKLLADRAGVSLGGYSKEKEDEKDKLYRMMEEASVFFTENLDGRVMDYLKGRGLEEKTIASFRIGFAKDEWRSLYDHLKTRFSDRELELAGLIKKVEGKSGYYDRFRNRIMFPIADSSGRIIAFSGRIFGDPSNSSGQEAPKYLNSPETPIFNKSSVLYGMDRAKDSIRKNNFSILVEGQMDLVMSHQAGFRNTVATSGTALSDSTISKDSGVSNLGLVRRLSQNIVLAFDADKAGISATIRAGKIALTLGMDVKVASIPGGSDPADLISKKGSEAWKDAIRNSKHLIEFMLAKATEDTNGDPRKLGRAVKEKILPYVASVESAIEKMHFLKLVSDKSGISLSALEEDLKKVEEDSKHGGEARLAESPFFRLGRKDYILRRLLGIVLWQASKEKKDLDTHEILKDLSATLNIAEEKILSGIQGSKEDLIFEAEVFYGSGANLKKDAEEMFSNLKEEHLKEKLNIKMRELHLAEEKKDQQSSSLILKEISEINKEIQDIKNGRYK